MLRIVAALTLCFIPTFVQAQAPAGNALGPVSAGTSPTVSNIRARMIPGPVSSPAFRMPGVGIGYPYYGLGGYYPGYPYYTYGGTYSQYGPGPGYTSQQPVAIPLPPSDPNGSHVSGQTVATLTLQFPAAAKVWLEGKEMAGKPESSRSLTSPVLNQGEKHTFHVKATWEELGKAYEVTKEVAIESGHQSKLLIVSGNPVPNTVK